ncbi:MAG: hypothetical protein JXR63_06475 [Spirochaetales bacterium]|nr:hypothetical protein [Spirochaetales bacterium]
MSNQFFIEKNIAQAIVEIYNVKMKKLLFVIFSPIILIWQLPQALLGAATALKFAKSFEKKIYLRDKPTAITLIYQDLPFSGVSLWPFILLNQKKYDTKVISHEYGHCIQSFILGPLYLPLVGLPSAIQCHLSHKRGGTYAANYFMRYPENWANHLGKVPELTKPID